MHYFVNFFYNNPLFNIRETRDLIFKKENSKYKVQLKPYIYFVKPKKEELNRFEYKKAVFLGSTLKSDLKMNINDTDRNGLIISNFYIEDPEVTDKKFKDEKLLNRRRYGFKPFKGEYVTDLFYEFSKSNIREKFRYHWLLSLPINGFYYNSLEPSSFGFNPILNKRPNQFCFTNQGYYNAVDYSRSKTVLFFFADESVNYLVYLNKRNMVLKNDIFKFGRRNRIYGLLGLKEQFYNILRNKNYFEVLRLLQYSVFFDLAYEKAVGLLRRYRRRFYYEKWIGIKVPKFFLFKSRSKFKRFPFFFSRYRYLNQRFLIIRFSLKILMQKKGNVAEVSLFRLLKLTKKIVVTNFKLLNSGILFYHLSQNFSKFSYTRKNVEVLNPFKNRFRSKIILSFFRLLTVKYYSNRARITYLNTMVYLPSVVIKVRYGSLRLRVLYKSFFRLLKILCVFISFSFRIAKISFNHLKYWKLFRKICSAVFIRLRLVQLMQLFFYSMLEVLLRKNFYLRNLSSFIYLYISNTFNKLNVFEKFFTLFLPNFLKIYYYGFKNNILELRLRFANADSFLSSKIWYKRLYQHYLFSTEVDEDFYTVFLAQFYFSIPTPLLFKNTLMKNYRQTRTNVIFFNFFSNTSHKLNKFVLKFKVLDNRMRYRARFYRDTIVDNLNSNEFIRGPVANIVPFRTLPYLSKLSVSRSV